MTNYDHLETRVSQKLLDQQGEIIDLKAERDEARNWARHGYEIGQRHCGWSDHGAAPTWLTDGWPHSFDSCEHLAAASTYDTALSRVRSLPERPDAMDANNPYTADWLSGYRAAIRSAKHATQEPERAVKSDGDAQGCGPECSEMHTETGRCEIARSRSAATAKED